MVLGLNSTRYNIFGINLMSNVLNRLVEVLQDRKASLASDSYVAKLYDQGNAKIIEKIQEECQELIEEITDDIDKEKVLHEAADLWFHVMVLLENNEINPLAILEVLEKREGLSGIKEKEGRK